VADAEVRGYDETVALYTPDEPQRAASVAA